MYAEMIFVNDNIQSLQWKTQFFNTDNVGYIVSNMVEEVMLMLYGDRCGNWRIEINSGGTLEIKHLKLELENASPAKEKRARVLMLTIIV